MTERERSGMGDSKSSERFKSTVRGERSCTTVYDTGSGNCLDTGSKRRNLWKARTIKFAMPCLLSRNQAEARQTKVWS